MVESQEGTAARQHHSSVTPQQPPESLILVHEEADGVCVKACGDYSGLISGPTALVCATGEKIALSNDFVRMFGGMGAAVELDSPSQISAATAASTSARKQFNVLALDISGISRLGKHPDTQTVHQVLRVASKLSEVLQKHEIGCLDEAALGEKVSVIAMAMAIQGSESTGAGGSEAGRKEAPWPLLSLFRAVSVQSGRDEGTTPSSSTSNKLRIAVFTAVQALLPGQHITALVHPVFQADGTSAYETDPACIHRVGCKEDSHVDLSASIASIVDLLNGVEASPEDKSTCEASAGEELRCDDSAYMPPDKRDSHLDTFHELSTIDETPRMSVLDAEVSQLQRQVGEIIETKSEGEKQSRELRESMALLLKRVEQLEAGKGVQCSGGSSRVLSASTETQDQGLFENMSDLCEMLFAADGDSTMLLHCRTISCGPSSNITNKASAWQHVNMSVQKKDITVENAASGLYSLGLLPEGAVVHTISCGKDKIISSGTLQLEPNTVLVLDETCWDTHLYHLVINGGAVVCHGEGCVVTFTDVTFDNCTLLALSGAQVTLNQSKFQHTELSQSPGLCIYAHGPGSKVAVRGGTISGGIQGATVQAGARFEAYGLQVSGVEVLGVEVSHEGSSLRLTDCTLQAFSSVYHELDIVCGVCVHSGSKADLSSLKVSGMVYGVAVHSCASVRLADSLVARTVSHCVALTLGATGNLDRCRLSRSQQRDGVFVEGEGSRADARHCHFVENSSGVFALNGGKLTASSCKSSGNKAAGFSAAVSGMITLARCASEKDAVGCAVLTGATLNARKVAVSNSEQAGFLVQSLGHIVLKECSVKQCGTFGVEVKGTGSWVDAEDCAVLESQSAGVQLLSSARGKLKGCTMARSALNSGVVALGKSTHLVLEECVMQQNAKCGVMARDQCVMLVAGCRSSRNRSHGFEAHSEAKITVRNSSSDGDSGGCSVCSGGRIMLEEATLDGLVKTGSLP